MALLLPERHLGRQDSLLLSQLLSLRVDNGAVAQRVDPRASNPMPSAPLILQAVLMVNRARERPQTRGPTGRGRGKGVDGQFHKCRLRGGPRAQQAWGRAGRAVQKHLWGQPQGRACPRWSGTCREGAQRGGEARLDQGDKAEDRDPSGRPRRKGCRKGRARAVPGPGHRSAVLVPVLLWHFCSQAQVSGKSLDDQEPSRLLS